ETGDHDRWRPHAEQRAITLAREGDGWRMLQGSKLIYVRLEADDSVRLDEPHFCARCSRLALSLGVAEWIFALSEGLVGYSCADYDAISQLGWLPTPPDRRPPGIPEPTATIKPDLQATASANSRRYGRQPASRAYLSLPRRNGCYVRPASTGSGRCERVSKKASYGVSHERETNFAAFRPRLASHADEVHTGSAPVDCCESYRALNTSSLRISHLRTI